jgi:hypothetical protein
MEAYMSKHIPIEFRLSADVNGTSFNMNGEGIGTPEDGTCVLHLEVDPYFPEGFDPVSCPCICSHPTSLYFAGGGSVWNKVLEGMGQQFTVQPARVGAIFSPSGEQLLRLEVDGHVSRHGDRVVSVHRMRGFSHLPKLARNLTPVDDVMIPSKEGEATALIRFKLLAEAGEQLDGMTTIPYQWSTPYVLPSMFTRRFESIDVEWDGGRRVSAYYQSSIRAVDTTEALDLSTRVV